MEWRQQRRGDKQLVPVEEIVGMEMSVFGFSVKMGMYVDEVHSEQKILISENLVGTSDLLNSVILREDDNTSAELGDQPKIMGCKDNRLSGFTQGKHEFHEEDLRSGVQAACRLVK